MIKYIRANVTPRERMRREFDSNTDYVPVPEDEEEKKEEEEFFFIDEQGETTDTPPSLKCPNSIQEMMAIVQEMRCQRAEHMSNFTYTAPVQKDFVADQENDEQEEVVAKKRRTSNYGLMAGSDDEE